MNTKSNGGSATATTADSEAKPQIKTFRDLIAWQKSMRLAKGVYSVTARMPDTERFGLTNQMRRSAVSIPSNIAEGYARQSTADYLKHLRTARGSLAELDTQVELAVALTMLQDEPRLNELLHETDRVLQGLIRSLQSTSKAIPSKPRPRRQST